MIQLVFVIDADKGQILKFPHVIRVMFFNMKLILLNAKQYNNV